VKSIKNITRKKYLLLFNIPEPVVYVTKQRLIRDRPVTSLGHLGGEEFSERGPTFSNYVQQFQTMSNTFLQGKIHT